MEISYGWKGTIDEKREFKINIFDNSYLVAHFSIRG